VADECTGHLARPPNSAYRDPPWSIRSDP